jgi:3-oxocholest-4-en-26-oyl-CoA dehydrogenase alpha subunit
VNIRFTAEQEEFRAEVRAFLAREVTPELHAQTMGAIEAHVPAFYEQLAARGWIGLTWPREYGGQGRPATDMAIFYEEMGRHLAPMGRYVATTVFVGGSILSYGSTEQKQRFLPAIASGRLLGSLGMTEPEAGSDAASLRTSAQRDGDSYVIDGEKIFISGAEQADRILTAVRTSTTGRTKRDGISLLLVPGNAPGLTVRAIHTVAGLRVNSVHFDGVRVPAEDLLGAEGNGWRHIQTTFGLERALSSAQLVGSLERTLADVTRLAVGAVTVGALEPAALDELCQCRAELEAARVLSYRAIWLDGTGQLSLDEAATAKLTRSELALRIATAGLRVLGEQALVSGASGLLGGRVEALYRRMQFYLTAGGSNDIQRNILAQQGLGLPR